MISLTTKEFWKLFDILPEGIRNQAVKKPMKHGITILTILAFILNPFTAQNLFILFVLVVVIGRLG